MCYHRIAARCKWGHSASEYSNTAVKYVCFIKRVCTVCLYGMFYRAMHFSACSVGYAMARVCLWRSCIVITEVDMHWK